MKPWRKFKGKSLAACEGTFSMCTRQEFWIYLNRFNGFQRSLSHLSTLLYERTDWSVLQMEQKFSGHSGRNGKRGIPLKVFLFSEKLPVERPVPFDFPPEQAVFPQMESAPGYSIN